MESVEHGFHAIPSALIGLGLLLRSINFQHVGLLHMGRAGFDGQEKPSDRDSSAGC